MSQDSENHFEEPAYAEPLEFQQPGPTEQGDATGGIIPYKNGHALVAYYLGVFSIIPCFGLLLAIPALILGIIGLKKRKANPLIKGSAHAWVGIIMGLGQVGSVIAGQTLIGQEADPRITGTTLGAFNFCGSVGTLVSSVLGGILFDVWTNGGPFLMMGIGSTLLLLGSIYVRVRHPG